MNSIDKENIVSPKAHQYRINHLLWLMTAVAVFVGLGWSNPEWRFVIGAVLGSLAVALYCQGPLRMGLRATWITGMLVLNISCSSIFAFGASYAPSNPRRFPTPAMTGDPATSFLIGILAFAPGSTLLSLLSAGIGQIVLAPSKRNETSDNIADARLD